MDEREFQSFYEQVAPALHAYLARSAGSRSLADDLTQESFYRFLRSGFAADDDDHRRSYLFRIASNLLKDHFRRRRSRPPEVESSAFEAGAFEPAAPDPEHERHETRQRLGRALAVLSARERQLLWLAHVEQFNHREIARILGLREGSVRVLAFHARRKLAERLRRDDVAAETTAPTAADLQLRSALS